MMNLAKTLAITATLFLAGCGTRDGGPSGSTSREAGEQVGHSVTAFAKGLGHGVDKQLEVTVELSEELTNLGLSKTIAKLATHDLPPGASKEKAITIYLMSQKPLQGTLLAKALNAEGQEIGRTTVEVKLAADDARYVDFLFPEAMDSQLVSKYVLSLRPTSPPAGQP